jgi:3-carboxy-cis,cis-muconate cycloisomerase
VRTEAGIFGGVFAHGGVDTSDQAWLAALLASEAALARALERAGLAPAGAGAAVTGAAQPGAFDPGRLGRAAALTGNPVPALVRALTAAVPPHLAAAIHQGATSQDIIDTAAMLLARQALTVTVADAAAGIPLRDALLGEPEIRARVDVAGVSPEQVGAALDPVGYLGAAGELVDAALAAYHRGGDP